MTFTCPVALGSVWFKDFTEEKKTDFLRKGFFLFGNQRKH